MAKKADNFLDYVPKHNSLFEWELNKENQVEVKVHNRGLFNRIAQIFFRRPKYSNIELEGMGTFIWQQIDGVRSVYEIGQLLKDEYGEEAEPLYERLSTYIKSLHNNQFIVYVNRIKNGKA